MALVNIDIAEYLDEVKTQYLIEELKHRQDKGDTAAKDFMKSVPVKELINQLEDAGLPKELVGLLWNWAENRMCLGDLLALTK